MKKRNYLLEILLCYSLYLWICMKILFCVRINFISLDLVFFQHPLVQITHLCSVWLWRRNIQILTMCKTLNGESGNLLLRNFWSKFVNLLLITMYLSSNSSVVDDDLHCGINVERDKVPYVPFCRLYKIGTSKILKRTVEAEIDVCKKRTGVENATLWDAKEYHQIRWTIRSLLIWRTPFYLHFLCLYLLFDIFSLSS